MPYKIVYSLLTTIVILLSGSSFLKAQYYIYNGPSYLAVNGGYSLPNSSFGKLEGSLTYNTFAKPGLNFGFEGAYFYSENIGFGMLVNMHIHAIDLDKLQQEYLKNYPEYSQAKADVSPFITVAPMMGFFSDLPVSNQFSFTFKLLTGFYIARKPAGKIVLTGNVPRTFDEQAAFSTNFAFYSSAGIRYSPFFHWSLHLNVEFVSSNFHFEFEKDGKDAVQNQLVRSILFTTAIAYRFSPR
jgi:hypothetical protein